MESYRTGHCCDGRYGLLLFIDSGMSTQAILYDTGLYTPQPDLIGNVPSSNDRSKHLL